MKIAGHEVGPRHPFFLIAGPCVIESPDLCFQVAETMKGITDRLGIPYVFKASFDKANRTSTGSFRGPGMEEGLQVAWRVWWDMMLIEDSSMLMPMTQTQRVPLCDPSGVRARG